MNRVKELASIAFSVIALCLFFVLNGMAVKDAWKKSTPEADAIASARGAWATTTAGLVAAIVATALGLPSPGDRKDGSRTRTEFFLRRLATSITTSSDGDKWKLRLAIAYVVVYILVGTAALAIMIFREEYASSVVRALALTFGGVMIAAAKAFLTFDGTSVS
jgi:hypothetical protein